MDIKLSYEGDEDIVDSSSKNLSFSLKRGKDTHVLKFVGDGVEGVGVSARIRLRRWKHIKYIAVGYFKDGVFNHLKVNNAAQELWLDVSFSVCGLAWQLQNESVIDGPVDFSDVRIFIKGVPHVNGAFLDVQHVGVNRERKKSLGYFDGARICEELVSLLYSHLFITFRGAEVDSLKYLATGDCPMPGDVQLRWHESKTLPSGLKEVNSFRYSWHALHLPIKLMLYAKKSDSEVAIYAAKSLIELWLDNSFYKADEDIKFAWYDHGTAERLLAFILMLDIATKRNFEKRFIKRLLDAVLKHTDLLSSEFFYAGSQGTRYHNHAWFQDISVLAASLALPNSNEANRWKEISISRFEDQLKHLIVRDKGFAIFVENSIAYHHGVERLVSLFGALVELSTGSSHVSKISSELSSWSEFFRYPDNRPPAQGDTQRKSPPSAAAIVRGSAWNPVSVTVLEKAGYAVVKGNHYNQPFMLNFLATALNNTHKHEDNLSITLWFDGVEWLIDPSYFSYQKNEWLPNFLRSASAHNCVSIAGAGYSCELGKTKLTKKEKNCNEGYDFCISGVHSCYENISVKRVLRGSLDELSFRVKDLVEHEATGVDFSINFIVGENVEVENLGRQSFTISSRDSNFKIKFDFIGGAHDIELEEIDVGTTFMKKGRAKKIKVIPDSEKSEIIYNVLAYR